MKTFEVYKSFVFEQAFFDITETEGSFRLERVDIFKETSTKGNSFPITQYHFAAHVTICLNNEIKFCGSVKDLPLIVREALFDIREIRDFFTSISIILL